MTRDFIYGQRAKGNGQRVECAARKLAECVESEKGYRIARCPLPVARFPQMRVGIMPPST